MKKFLLGLFILSSIGAMAAQYQDGTYRGVFVSGQETQVEVQFDLKDDVISNTKYRTLYYKGHNWLKEDEYIAKNEGYLKALKETEGKKVGEVIPTLYNQDEIANAGATVRKTKIRAAIQAALNLGPYALPKK